MIDLGAFHHRIGGQERPGPDWVISELAKLQYGVVARSQLIMLGISARQIDRRLTSGRLHCLYRGVYSPSPLAPPLRGRWLGAVLACGDGAVLSHRDAGAHWDLPSGYGRVVNITASRKRHSQRGIKVHGVRSLHPSDVTEHEGIAVTTIARTLLDIAETEPFQGFERCFEQAERLNRLDFGELDATLRRSHGRRGQRPLLSLIAQYRGAPESRTELERNFVDFCRKHHIPEPQMNVVVCGYEVDAVWHEQKLIAELDSWSFHRGRRAFEDDRERDIVLQLARYRPIRVTDRRIRTAASALAREIVGLLAAPATTR